MTIILFGYWNISFGLFSGFLERCRSSHRRCSVEKGVLKNFAKFTGKHLCQSLFFNKAVGLRPDVNFSKFLRTPFLQNNPGWLLLEMKIFAKDWKWSINYITIYFRIKVFLQFFTKNVKIKTVTKSSLGTPHRRFFYKLHFFNSAQCWLTL